MTVFVASAVSNLNLFGLDWIERLHLLDVPLNHICNQLETIQPHESIDNLCSTLVTKIRHEFAPVFGEGLGCCTKMKAVLRLRTDARPVFRPKRPVPYAVLPILDQELDRLQSSGIIEPVNYSLWAAPIVVVKKANGTLPICADFSTGLNAALEMHQFPLPVPEDVFTKLNGGKYFAKHDFSDTYL